MNNIIDIVAMGNLVQHRKLRSLSAN